MTLVADPLGQNTPDKQGVNCLSPRSLSHIAWWKSEEDCNLNYYEISQNNNGHCFQDYIFLLYMHCFENYVLSYKTCFVLKVTFCFESCFVLIF